MTKLFYIAAGGALGAVLRYSVSGWSHRLLPGIFPWGTLVVNLAGSLVIGMLWALFEVTVVSQNARLFLFMGLLGSFTTFSTFSLEGFHMIRDGEFGYLLWNILLNVVLGIGFVFAGYMAVRQTVHILR